MLLVMSFMVGCPFEIETVSWSRFIGFTYIDMRQEKYVLFKSIGKGGKNFREFGGEYFWHIIV